MAKDKFKSIDELREEMDFNNKFTISYAGENYTIHLSLEDGKDKFYAFNIKINKRVPGYDTFDEMLDNLKAPDGKTLREFLLDAEVEWADVGIGEMGAMNGPGRA